MSVVADELMAPSLGFTGPQPRIPLRCHLVTHLRGFLAHLVFGLAVGSVTETAWALAGR